MADRELVLIHFNPALEHQRRQADAFASGLTRLDLHWAATTDPAAEADVHICLGPNYALRYWAGHPRTVLLDRAYWGDARRFVTLGWLHADGGRTTAVNCPPDRWQIQGEQLLPLREQGGKTIVLGDYSSTPGNLSRAIADHKADAYRPHPMAPPWPECPVPIITGPLELALADYSTAVGWRTSALVTAGLQGLHLVSLDDRGPARRWAREYREGWCYDLAYANWHESEIADGTAWEWLENVADTIDATRRAAGYGAGSTSAARY